jgi:hypothetical protein
VIVWLSSTLAGFGGGIIGAFVIEAYQQRRAQDEVGLYDKGMEDDSAHRAS